MIKILPYREEFDAGVRALCRIPVSSNISLALEREPNYLIGAKVQCETEEVYVCYDKNEDKIWAVFNVGKRSLWYQNKIEKVRYLCDLRIHPEKQNSSLLFSIIKKFNELSRNENLPAQTVIFADNHKMNDLVNRVKKSNISRNIPHYHHLGHLFTYLFPLKTKQKIAPPVQIRKAAKSDAAEMQALMNEEGPKINYFPYYDFEHLDQDYYQGLSYENYYLLFENKQLVGMLAVWDQSAFKQTRISSYSLLYRLIRPIYNLFADFLPSTKLPLSGEILHYCYFHSLLIKNRNPKYFESLLAHVLTDMSGKGYDYLLCSLDSQDSLSQVPAKFGFDRKIKGNYFLVNQGEEIPDAFKQPFFYLEGARI